MANNFEAEIELYQREYDPQKGIANWQQGIGHLEIESERVRQRLPCRLDVAYGNDPLQKLDLYVPEAANDAPIQMFLHGGGWHGGDKSSRGYPAEWFVPKGVIWISVNYRLAPAANLDETSTMRARH